MGDERASAGTGDLGADVVVFLMAPGWKDELRSNRWHYASRWARLLPVILVQPVQWLPPGENRVEKEERIPNCEILYVTSSQEGHDFLHRALMQVEQLRRHLEWRGFKRIIFWMYNADFVAMMALMPAVARVYHATENHLMYPGVSSWFVDRMHAALGTVDLTVCCSEGVRRGYEPHTRGKCVVVTNGCDFGFYAPGGLDEGLQEAATSYSKVAIYAGNINNRLDFELLADTADALPDVLFSFFGRVHLESHELRDQWASLIGKANVRHFGLVEPDRLPPVYGTADVGFMPYAQDSLVTDNTFPIKTFEMVATELPVVATNLKMLSPLKERGIEVVWSTSEFIEAIRDLSRETLSSAERRRLRDLAAEQDYDGKFDVVLARITDLLESRQAPITPVGSNLGFETLDELELSLRGTFQDPTIGDLVRKLSYAVARKAGVTVWPILPAGLRKRLKSLWLRQLGIARGGPWQ